MDINEITKATAEAIKAQPELRSALLASYVVEVLKRLKPLSPEDAKSTRMDLNPHLSLRHYCQIIVAAVKANLDEDIDAQFVMEIWCTNLWLDSLRRQVNNNRPFDEVHVYHVSPFV